VKSFPFVDPAAHGVAGVTDKDQTDQQVFSQDRTTSFIGVRTARNEFSQVLVTA